MKQPWNPKKVQGCFMLWGGLLLRTHQEWFRFGNNRRLPRWNGLMCSFRAADRVMRPLAVQYHLR